MIHRGTYDGTIYHNPVNRFCIISVKTADKEVPQEARSTRRYKDHLIRFVATGYELPRTDAVELELDGEWTKGKYGVQLQVEQWREIVPKTRDGVEGYATTIHKAMGSEYETVIMPLLKAHTVMLYRNLLYTGITRAKKRVVLIGQKQVLFMAIHRNEIVKRNTLLGARIGMYYKAYAKRAGITVPAAPEELKYAG